MYLTIRLYTYILCALLLSSCARKNGVGKADLALIEADELRFILQGNNPFVIIDVRPYEEYMTGHIQGAVNTYRPDYTQTKEGISGFISSKEQMEELLQTLGATTDKTIVIYDDKGNPDAARLWWILEQYGHKRTVLLNGGYKYWKMRNFEQCTAKCSNEPSDFQFENEKKMKWYASMDYVQNNLPNITLIDTRSKEEYSGEYKKPGAQSAGRIPESIWLDYYECFNNENSVVKDYRFRPVSELKRIFDEFHPDDEIVLYCHSGVRSAYMTFVLTQLLDYSNVRNYDGSWVEWSAKTQVLN